MDSSAGVCDVPFAVFARVNQDVVDAGVSIYRISLGGLLLHPIFGALDVVWDRTAMTAAIPEDHKTIFAKRRVPLRRYAEPEEVAHGTLSLVLPAAGYINGVALPVDGGMTIKNA